MVAYCERTGLDPLRMSVRHAELYARWMVETAVEAGDDPPTPKTVAQRMSAVSAWYKYLIKNDAARFNSFAEAGRPLPRERRGSWCGGSRGRPGRVEGDAARAAAHLGVAG
ncbi:hypothetical protein [Nonomuraea lactucae]|uniref:hypothetical protein n=1 Tax=Nonomuraea lactucae TaxID=2249762 RepID=UPI000DE341A3|nr:hypothetical protein [Nonomuraea lactucae]